METRAHSEASVAGELAKSIRRHRDLYYNGTPEISDAEFDALEDRLREIDPAHPVLAEVGAPPVERVERSEGALSDDVLEATLPLARELQDASDAFYTTEKKLDKKTYEKRWFELRETAPVHPVFAHIVPPSRAEWEKAQHELPMGSLNKVNSAEELEQWAERCDGLAAESSVEPISKDLSMTEKLDGISIEVIYIDGVLDAAITRGNGQVGERITPNVQRMQGVPPKIPAKGSLSVRGEVVLRKSDADRFIAAKVKIDKDFNRQLSLRNSAAGQARAKDPKSLPMCEMLTILFYDVEGAAGIRTEREKLTFLEKLGFTTPNFVFGDIGAIHGAYDEYHAEKRQKLDYEIDGLVVRANDIDGFTLLGDLNNRPRAAIAYKFPSEMKVSTLKAILWETGPSGRITPVAIVEPVRLAGANVERASLHNMANVSALKIGVGDQVLVSRRNDVIPYIEKVEVKGAQTETIPERCNTCHSDVVIEGEYLLCRNDECAARKIGRLKTWIRHIGLLEWGERTLERLYDERLATEPADLYRLKVEDISGLEGYGEATAKKLLEPLNALKEIPITTFIAALGIESVSQETARLLVGAGYDDLASIADASLEDLAAIEGLGEIKAEKITSGMKSRLEEIKRLAEVGVVPVAPKEGGPLAGKSFCFSGAASKPRKVLHQIVEKNGGTVSTGVKKGLTYLVLQDASSTSSKAQKARKLGTEIIDETMFEAMISEAGGSFD